MRWVVLFGERDFLVGVFKSSSFSWRPFRKNKTNFPLTKKENIQSIGWWFPTHMKNSWIISQNRGELKKMKPPPSLLTSTRSSTKMTGWFWGSEAKLEAVGPREGNCRQLGCWAVLQRDILCNTVASSSRSTIKVQITILSIKQII